MTSPSSADMPPNGGKRSAPSLQATTGMLIPINGRNSARVKATWKKTLRICLSRPAVLSWAAHAQVRPRECKTEGRPVRRERPGLISNSLALRIYSASYSQHSISSVRNGPYENRVVQSARPPSKNGLRRTALRCATLRTPVQTLPRPATGPQRCRVSPSLTWHRPAQLGTRHISGRHRPHTPWINS